MKLVQAIRNKRDTDLNFAKHGYEKPNRPSLELLDYINLRYALFLTYKKPQIDKFTIQNSG